MEQNRKKKGNLPNLRFPEFEGEWEERKLGEVCTFVRGPFGSALKKEFFVNEGNAVYEQSHAIYGDFNSFRYYITNDKFEELKRFSVKPNDLIMSCSGTMGKFAIIPLNARKGVINQALLKLTSKDGYYYEFIKNALELPTTQNKLLTQSAGGAIKNIVGMSELKEIVLSFPKLEEQNKIVSFLTLIDKRIETQRKIIEDFRIVKECISNELLLNNNWSEYQICNIATIGRGRVINSDEIKKQRDPKYPVYSSQTSNNGIMGYLDNYDFEGEYVTWTTDGANAGTVFYRNGKFNCTNVCGTLKINNKHNPYFVSLCLGLVAKKYVFVNLANPKLMNNVMASIKVSLPDLDAQDEIARFFRDVQTKIELEKSLLRSYVEIKRYLLQSLFI